MTIKNNLYMELEPETNNQDLRKLSRYQNLYIKIRTSNLQALSKLPDISNKCLTIEILNNCKLEKENALEKFIHIQKPNRIIVTINKKINTELLDYLSYIGYNNISLDLYWAKDNNLQIRISKLIDKFPFINHISIYPVNKQQLYLNHNFLGFTRYHHNMWSKDLKKYYAQYDLTTIRDRQYKGIGTHAISRKKYAFYKNNVQLNLSKEYIDIQDHVDRLSYYIPMEKKELLSYPLINQKQYMKDLETKETIQVHQELISNLLES